MTWLMEILRIYPEEQLHKKVLRDKAFNITKNPKYDRYQRELALMVYRLFDKKSLGGFINIFMTEVVII